MGGGREEGGGLNLTLPLPSLQAQYLTLPLPAVLALLGSDQLVVDCENTVAVRGSAWGGKAL